jgi:hypothetical protein
VQTFHRGITAQAEADFGEWSRGGSAHATLLYSDKDGVYTPRGDLQVYLKDEAKLNVSFSAELDTVLGTDHEYRASMVLSESVMYGKGELLVVSANIYNQGKQDDTHTWLFESSIDFDKDSIHYVSGLFTLDMDYSADDTLGVSFKAIDGTAKSGSDGTLVELFGTAQTISKGAIIQGDIHFGSRSRGGTLFSSFTYTNDDAIYSPTGVLKVTAKGNVLLNATAAANLDTKYGNDGAVSASVSVVETAQLNGNLVSASVNVGKVAKDSNGVKFWTGDISVDYKDKSKLDATAVFKVDAEYAGDNTLGAWVTLTNNKDGDNDVLVELYSSVETLSRGLTTQAFLEVSDESWVHFYATADVPSQYDVYSPRGLVVFTVNESPILNATAHAEVDVGRDDSLGVSLVVEEWAQFDGQLVAAAANLVTVKKANDGLKAWKSDASFHYKRENKFNVSAELTVDMETQHDDSLGMYGTVTNNNALLDDHGDAVVAALSANIRTIHRGMITKVEIDVDKKRWMRLYQKAEVPSSAHGLYYPYGEFALSLNDDPAVLNVSVNIIIDTQLGHDDAISASLVLLESAQYGGELVAAAAKIISVKKTSDYVKVWRASVVADVKEDSALDVEGVLTVDSTMKDDNTVGIYGHVSNFTAKKSALASFSSTFRTFDKGFTTEVDVNFGEWGRGASMRQHFAYPSTDDGVYSPNGELYVILKDETLLNASLSSTIDTKLGTDHSYSASMVLTETACYNGELISAYANVIDGGKNKLDGSQTWTLESALTFDEDPKHAATTVLKLNLDGRKDDTLGAWLTVMDNLGQGYNVVAGDTSAAPTPFGSNSVLTISSSVQTFHRGITAHAGADFGEWSRGGSAHATLLYPDKDGVYTPRCDLQVYLKDEAKLNVSFSAELDTVLGTDHKYRASMVLSESVMYGKGELLVVSANIYDEGEIEGMHGWTGASSIFFKKESKMDAFMVLKLDTEMAGDETMGVWFTAIDNKAKDNADKELVSLSSSVANRGGFESHAGLHMKDKELLKMSQRFAYSSSDGVFMSHGDLDLVLNENPVLHANLTLELDTELGAERTLSASLLLTESVQYSGGKVLAIAADLVSAEKDAAGVAIWIADITVEYVEDSKLDWSGVLKLDTGADDDDTVGVWAEVKNRNANNNGENVAMLSSWMKTFTKGFSSSVDLEVQDQSWVRAYQSTSCPSSSSGAYAPQGVFRVALNDSLVFNSSFEGTLDFKYGPDSKIGIGFRAQESLFLDVEAYSFAEFENSELFTMTFDAGYKEEGVSKVHASALMTTNAAGVSDALRGSSTIGSFAFEDDKNFASMEASFIADGPVFNPPPPLKGGLPQSCIKARIVFQEDMNFTMGMMLQDPHSKMSLGGLDAKETQSGFQLGQFTTASEKESRCDATGMLTLTFIGAKKEALIRTPAPSALPPLLTPKPFPSPTAQSALKSTPRPSANPVPTPPAAPTLEPTPAPSSMPTALDTVRVAVSLELTASAEPTDSDKTYLKTKIARTVGVDEQNLRRFTVVSSLGRRLQPQTLLRQRRELLATYTWTVTFDVVVSLADTSSSLSSELVSFVASSLTDSSFVSDVARQVGAAVDTNSVVTLRITRQPTPTPTIEPTAPPVVAPAIGGTTSTDDAVSASDGDASAGANEASPLIGILAGLLGLGLVAAVAYFFYRRAKVASHDNDSGTAENKSGTTGLQLKVASSNGLTFLKRKNASPAALAAAPQQNVVAATSAVTASNDAIHDLVEGSVKHFLNAQAKVTNAKRLNMLTARFSELGYESASDFQGMSEEELVGIKAKTGLILPEMRRFKAALETMGNRAKGLEPSSLPAAKMNPSGTVEFNSSVAGTEVPLAKNNPMSKESGSGPSPKRSFQELKAAAEAPQQEVAPPVTDEEELFDSIPYFFSSARNSPSTELARGFAI